jgi:hypothetical protein
MFAIYHEELQPLHHLNEVSSDIWIDGYEAVSRIHM